MGTSFLVGCGGGGGGGGSDASGGDRPLSLNGVTLEFREANLTFSTATPNTSSGSTETGGIVYQRRSDVDLIFSPSDPFALDAIELSWPEDLGGATRYEYTPIDGISGRLLIYADNAEGGTFLNHAGTTNFDVFTLTFTASGGVITSINSVTRVNIAGTRYVREMNLTGRVATLTSNPRFLPAGWNGINEGPGFVADPSFDGKVLTLNEDGTNTEIQFGTFIATTAVTTGISETRELGLVAVTLTTNAGLPTENVETFSANYTLVQPFGTEQGTLTLNYISGTTALPPAGTVTLTFRAGELLTSGVGTVSIRTGTYTSSDATTGTFILDRS